MWDLVLVPGAVLASSLEVLLTSLPPPFTLFLVLKLLHYQLIFSSVGVIPLESGTIVPLETVSGMLNPPASPQDDLDVPLSKLVSGRVEDKVTEAPEETARPPTPKSPVVGVCTPPTHVGEAPPPPAQEKLERREVPAVPNKRLPHDLLHICLGLSEHLGVRLHRLSLNMVSFCVQIDSFYSVCVFGWDGVTVTFFIIGLWVLCL